MRNGRRAVAALFAVATVFAATVPAAAQQAQPDATALVNHLNNAIGWYRHLMSANETAGRPSDALYLQTARDLARQALQLAFQSARSEAELLSGEAAQPVQQPGSSSTERQNLDKAAASTEGRIQQIQSQLSTLAKQIPRARIKARKALLSQRDKLQGELSLEKALQDTIQKLTVFMRNSQNGQTGLLKEIVELKRSVPGLSGGPGTPATSQAPKAGRSPSQRASGEGLIGEVSILFGQYRDVRNVDQLMDETSSVRKLAVEARAPLLQRLHAIITEGRNLANSAGSSDTAQATRNLSSLTTRFKAASTAAVPLTQEVVLLDQCRANLAQWRDSIKSEDGRILRSVLARVFAILIGLGIVVLFSEIWRRATVRYVHELRRRRQLLLVRRFVTGLLMVVVIALGFITEFSSLATFAGFLTAGIAVALQTVILSAAAYFFLIGRYGVRVGDRVTVMGVSGDVVDIGLVRFHMMELAGTDNDLYPTGRIVAFSNSVLFQNAPLFRQIPGTGYAWHEVAIQFERNGYYKGAQAKLLEGVNSVYSEYRQSLERQQDSIERVIDTAIPLPSPGAKTHYTEKGLELVVRYPVDVHHASEIDNRVSQKITEIINASPDLKATASPPQVRPALKG